MNAHALQSTWKFLSLFAIIAAILVPGTSSLWAQSGWEEVYGNPSCQDAGWAVAPVCRCDGDINGGYVVAGETFSKPFYSVGCNTNSDVYVAKRNANGTIAWAFSYDLGGNDSALDIKQCKFQSGYIVVGVTDNANIYCNYSRNLFLMKLSCNGGVQWVETYGYPDWGEEVGASVIETQQPAQFPSNFGDFVVAGWTTGSPSGNKDAYLLRVSGGGLLVSDMVIDLGDDDFLYEVTEARNGDLIAAGGTVIPGLGLQGLLIRAPGGLLTQFPSAPIWTQHYGGSGDEVFRSVQELGVWPNINNIVAAGYSTSNLASADVYMIKANPNGQCLASSTYGGPGWDEGYRVREVCDLYCGETIPTVCYPHNQFGDLILTGRANFPPGGSFPAGHGGDDVLGLQVPPTLITPASVHLYGGPGQEWGRSIEFDPFGSDFRGTQTIHGYAMCGFTKSGLDMTCAPNDPEQLYLIKTNCAWQTDCPPIDFTIQPNPGPCEIQVTPQYFGIGQQCRPYTSAQPMFKKNGLCNNTQLPCSTAYFKQVPSNNEKDMDPGSGYAPDEVDGYPNPVRKGDMFQISYETGETADIHITVTDITGAVTYRSTKQYSTGSYMLGIPTQGLSSGVYLVKIDNGIWSKTSRMVIQDK